MLSRIIGSGVALVSLFFYIWHLAQQGAEPRNLQALLAGMVFLFGLWLALPDGGDKADEDTSRVGSKS